MGIKADLASAGLGWGLAKPRDLRVLQTIEHFDKSNGCEHFYGCRRLDKEGNRCVGDQIKTTR